MKALCACLTMFAVAVPALLSAEPGGGESLFLTREGKCVASIVLPEDAPIPVSFAAMELRYYLERMSGARIEFLNRIPEDRVCIVLGEDYGAKANIDVSKVERDGFIIKTIGKQIYIAGRDDRSIEAKVLLAFRSSNFSPTQTIGVRPFFKADFNFLLTISFVS